MTSLQYLIDEAAIRGVIARFADVVTHADLEAFRALWSADAQWTIEQPFEQHAQGVEAITAMLGKLWTGNDYFIQFVTPGVIEIDGDEATARTPCHEEARGPNGRFYRNNGVWLDHLRRSGDSWVFTSRTYRYLRLDLTPFAGDTFMAFPQQR